MCGFAGLLDPTCGAAGAWLESTVLGMADTLHRRGPDDRGAWVDPDAGVALGFRRLSIVDLSPEGRQPMRSAGGRYVLAFNGEIYNHADFRRELEGTGARFRGHSDTETMLAAIERWGLTSAIGRFVGMFAFALWDRTERVLHLGRDRMGEKPLFYGWSGSTFLFGSELKALRAYPEFRAEIDREALRLFMRHGYVPSPYAIYRGFRKLLPGTMASLGLREAEPGRLPEPAPYWSAQRVAEAAGAEPYTGTDAEAIDRLDALLRDAVRGQMVADVPLGAFLSGGIDSSTIVALMQAQSSRPVKTFTIGFHEAGFDEAPFARKVAAHLGTEHTELYVTPEEARGVIPELPTLYDEPFADSSSIPTFLVSRLARREVTVSLSGDGGDELFGGYPWYGRTARVWGMIRRVPRALRRPAAATLEALAGATMGRFVPESLSRRFAPDRLLKGAELLGRSTAPEEVHRLLATRWSGATARTGGNGSEPRLRTRWDVRAEIGDVVARATLLDALTYLPDDILTKVDRASMGVSLESRAPLLDHRVVEFALGLPTSLKIRDGQGKWVLRRVLDRHVPRDLIERPKRGFSIPLGAWLRGPLREWAESLLDQQRLTREGLLDPTPIRQAWRDHLSGRRDAVDHLWFALMFQAWRDTWPDQAASAARG